MNSGELRLRVAVREDVPLIIELIRGLAEYERLTDVLRIDQDALCEHLFGEHRYAEVLIAEVGDRVAGYALFFHTYSTFLMKPGIWLEDIFVPAPFRRRGVGKALLARLAEIALSRGCGRLEWSVLDWNKPAIAFYQELGARPVDGWSCYRLSGEPLERLGARPAAR